MGRARRALRDLSLEELRARAGRHGIGYALEGVQMIWWDPLFQRERTGTILWTSKNGVTFLCDGMRRWVEAEHLLAIIC